MEYNYTKEWKQPNKVYRIGALDVTALFPEGIKLSIIIAISLSVFSVVIVGLMSMVKGVTFISTIFRNGYLLIAIVVALMVWTLSTLKYDNKSFFSFFLGRFRFMYKKKYALEHEDRIIHMGEPITYSKLKT